jgi:hypothetical protein
MSLIFGVCANCDESHALQSSGQMSIHITAEGERCAGALTAPSIPTVDTAPQTRPHVQVSNRPVLGRGPVPEPASDPPSETPHGRAVRREAQRVPRLSARNTQMISDSELEEAFYEAGVAKRPPEKVSGPMDKRIYATSGARILRGGLPTLGGNR